MVEDKKKFLFLYVLDWAAAQHEERKKIGENEIDNKVFGKSPEKFSFTLFSTPMLFINGNCLFSVRKYILASVCAAVFIHILIHNFLSLQNCEVEKKNCFSYFCCFRIISHDTLTVCDVMTESCFFTYFPHSQLWKKERWMDLLYTFREWMR